METPAFLKPIQSYPGEIVQFIERIPGVDVTGDRETVLERLEPYHKAEVEALGWRWKDLRRAEQVHGTRVALVGDIGCEVMLRVGTATLAANTDPGLIDVSTGGTLNNGGALTANHLYMATIADRTVQATAATVKLLVRGEYTVS